MTRKDLTESGRTASPGTEPGAIDLRERSEFPFDCLTEATVKFVTPEARRAQERQIRQQAAHEHRLDFVRLAIAGVLLIGFLCLSTYLLVFKPDATEHQQILAVVAAIASGGGVYVFGNKTKTPS